MLKKTINSIIENKIKINKNSLFLNILFQKSFLNFNFNFLRKKEKRLFKEKYKKDRRLFNFDNFALKLKFGSIFINYFFKLFQNIILNNFKIKILLHKKFINLKEIFEKA